MNSKNIKVVDEHNIDRSANVLFAFALEGSEFVSYSIERDAENSNIFVSKIIKNLDNTFSMLDVDNLEEKSKLNDIVKKLITSSVENQADKLSGDSVTLADGKVVKFINVFFNKEQRINVQKTYITTVKKEVVRVVEKYYDIEVVSEKTETTDIFPNVFPVIEETPSKEEVVETVQPVVNTQPTEVVSPVLSTPTVELPKSVEENEFAPFGSQSATSNGDVNLQSASKPVVESSSVNVVPSETVSPAPAVVEPITVSNPQPEATLPAQNPVVDKPLEDPTVVIPTPVGTQPVNNTNTDTLVFNASKESNLNAALGELSNSAATIPVENIEPIREFGVEEPVNSPVNVQQPVTQPVPPAVSDETSVSGSTQKAGFANSKFFMVVAIAFFLASCVFLGYEVFNYFQLTK